MPKTELGAVLFSHGWVTQEQIHRSIQHQRTFGGRIGTCLLEIDGPSEERVLRALSEQLGYPATSCEDLQSIPDNIIQLLPPDVAVRCSAIPFSASGSRVDVALLDVGDLALEDELAFTMGRRLRPYIATEIRILEALHRYYDARLPRRFQMLIDRLNGDETANSAPKDLPPSSSPGNVDSPRPQPRAVEGNANPRRSAKITYAPRQFERRSIQLSEGEREALEASRTRPSQEHASESPPAGPKSFEDQFVNRLSHAETASQIGEFLIEALAEIFDRSMLFRVSSAREEITGWMSRGEDVDVEWFRHYSVGLHQATVFRRFTGSPNLFAGRLDATPAHQALARCWGGSLSHECLLLPINVRRRLTCVICADNGGRGLSGVDFDLLQRIATKTALAFERCILRRKMQST